MSVTREDEYAQMLKAKNLWPTDPDTEENWSGRGEHLELTFSEKAFLDEKLQFQELLARTTTAVVDRVKCGRISLARKTITCNRHFTKQQAIEEIAHLKSLNHAHIVRGIGTYLLGSKLSILIYPATQYNLGSFLEAIDDTSCELKTGSQINTKLRWTLFEMADSCLEFCCCLSSALSYIHSKFIKHMDIKPHNILVNVTRGEGLSSHILPGERMYTKYTVFLADFGTSRSYQELSATETDGPAMFTRKYAAPEVVSQEKHGLPGDIFSMGCVFLEITAALGTAYDVLLDDEYRTGIEFFTTNMLHNFFEESVRTSCAYHSNAQAICTELLSRSSGSTRFPYLNSMYDWILGETLRRMLSEDPKARLSAAELLATFRSTPGCCDVGSKPLEASYTGVPNSHFDSKISNNLEGRGQHA
jgi:serine/threonine protein kinase